MPINDIRLQNFRSYKDETFEFEPGVNIIVGPNASGKTNILDAIRVVCVGTSHRNKDHELIRYKNSWARVDANSDKGPRTVKIKLLESEKTTKELEIDKQSLRRISLEKTLPVVLFEPNDLQLLVGSPERRREYLDSLIEQTVVGYGQTRRKYRRALNQRNSLLKQNSPTINQQIFSWNIRLSQLAGEIIHYRLQLVERINEEIQTLYQKLSKDKTNIEFKYLSATNTNNYESNLLKELEATLELDALRGFTARGPHRDDFGLLMDGHKANEAASRGEIRTLLLALKIIEVRLLEEKRLQKPILLLDDVFSELDGARRRALTRFLTNYQTFITTTDADVVVQHFMDEAHIIPLTKQVN